MIALAIYLMIGTAFASACLPLAIKQCHAVRRRLHFGSMLVASIVVALCWPISVYAAIRK